MDFMKLVSAVPKLAMGNYEPAKDIAMDLAGEVDEILKKPGITGLQNDSETSVCLMVAPGKVYQFIGVSNGEVKQIGLRYTIEQLVSAIDQYVKKGKNDNNEEKTRASEKIGDQKEEKPEPKPEQSGTIGEPKETGGSSRNATTTARERRADRKQAARGKSDN